jgi:hypothetical protein
MGKTRRSIARGPFDISRIDPKNYAPDVLVGRIAERPTSLLRES